MKNINLFNRKGLKSFRSALRNRSTSAEAALWNILKSRNIDGRKFRRQYSIDNYIVDFCCPLEKLIIELDGAPLPTGRQAMVNIIEYWKMKTGINTINHPGRDQSLQYIYYNIPRPPLLQKEGRILLPIILP